MNNESLINQLKSLSRVTPDPIFLKWSRCALLAETTPRKQLFNAIRFRFSFAPLALGLATLLVFLISKTPFPAHSDIIASLNPAAIRLEEKVATAHDPSIETAYFKGIAPNIALALNDISDPSTNWGSANHIKQGMSLLYETQN